MNKKKILELICRGPNWFNALLLKLNINSRLVFGKKYYDVYSNFLQNDCTIDVVKLFNKISSEVPYYKNKYPDIRIKTMDDFKKTIEFIDKDIILENFDSFCNSSIETRKNLDSCTTGGTSGKPLKLLLPQSRYINELGSLHALWSKIGYQFSPRAVVRNEKIIGRDYIINPVTKEFIFDGFRTDEKYLSLIYRTMRKYKIPFFHGYTSNAERFANYILDSKCKYDFLKGFITTSENFYDHQKITFKKLNNVKHMNFYGHSEKLILAGWCEEGDCYHFYNSYGLAELIDSDGNDQLEVGEIGELVGSTNYNVGMPLFRYRTGDYAIKASEICPGCGFKGLSASKILGRWNGDRIYSKDGSFITTTALNLHSDLYEKINGLQYYQPEKGIIIIRIIPNTLYDSETEKKLINSVKIKMSNDCTVLIEKVDSLKKHSNGKFLLLISDICKNNI